MLFTGRPSQSIPFLFLFSFLLLPFSASAADTRDAKFKDFINRDTDGSWFDQSILLDNLCDFSQCRTEDCALRVFSDTVLKQEWEYVSEEYGVKGKDWEVSGNDVVQTYESASERYYDDLGVNIFATSENKVLHFDVTGSFEVLRDFVYNLKE